LAKQSLNGAETPEVIVFYTWGIQKRVLINLNRLYPKYKQANGHVLQVLQQFMHNPGAWSTLDFSFIKEKCNM